MPPSLSPTSPRAHRSSRRDGAPSQRARERRRPGAHPKRQPLTRYTDPHGSRREVVLQQGWAGSMLVVDRDATTYGDRRLVAHLAADEPAGNAVLVCSHYLPQATREGARCRRLTAEDTLSEPFEAPPDGALPAESTTPAVELVDGLGRSYRLELLPSGMSIPELRWQRYPSQGEHGAPAPVSVRDAVASLESYEPVRTLTLQALARHGRERDVSTTVLSSELRRVQESPIVLNRRLREVVLASAARRALSMSEIASRCGRIKRDGKGKESGETSWLARRIGLLPEAGRSNPTPWIHSDVLALISRRGLGIAPLDVELT
jgi:hypothetical protein